MANFETKSLREAMKAGAATPEFRFAKGVESSPVHGRDTALAPVFSGTYATLRRALALERRG
jgi:hypothetical protein